MGKIYKRKNDSAFKSGSSSNILSNGEMFLEAPSNDNNDYRIKIGDGTTSYDNLSYAIGGPNMTFRDGEIVQEPGVNISETETNNNTDASVIINALSEDLSYISEDHNLSEIMGSVKSAITRSQQALYKIRGLNSLGSIVTILTDSTSLYNRPVQIEDGDGNVYNGQIDNTGYCRISGITSTGTLTATTTFYDSYGELKEIKNTITVTAYSNYTIRLYGITIYGFRVENTGSNTTVSYNVKYNNRNVDNYDYTGAYMNHSTDTWVWGDWTSEEFFMPVPCLISQNYQNKIYLNPDDYTKDINDNDVTQYLNGTEGNYNAMMEWGRNGNKIYYKIVPDENNIYNYNCYFSDYKIDDGFHCWSFYDQNNDIADHFYTAIYQSCIVNNVSRSISGKTCGVAIGSRWISTSEANNVNGENYAWSIDNFADRLLINLLTVLITKSVNSQSKIGYGQCNGSASITSGGLNTVGYFYGKSSNNSIKMFGMENYFGLSWKICNGLNFENSKWKYKLTYSTADGSAGDGYRKTTSASISHYIDGPSGNTAANAQYISKMYAYASGILIPMEFGGSASTYYTDYAQIKNGSGTYLSGSFNNTTGAGIWCMMVDNLDFSYSQGFGSMLSLKPVVNLD